MPSSTGQPDSPLDDPTYPAFSMGAAVKLLGVQPDFLRGLGGAGLIEPARSAGGHRRYSRRDLELATRARELVDTGMPLAAACRIVALEHSLAGARDVLAGTQADLVDSRADLAGAQADLADSRAQLADRTAELTGARYELDGVRARLAAADATIARLRHQQADGA